VEILVTADNDGNAAADAPAESDAAVRALADALLDAKLTIATAESCTGGLIAAACTSVAGSSDWFERGFVTYSNEAKTELLGVAATLIATRGAVSDEVARAMAEGALARSHAQIAVAVTGIAGPGGGSPGKPVGTVWMAIAASSAATRSELLQLSGDRRAIREKTVQAALARLLAAAQAMRAG
jgi:nicotinamide-nucleotide amidase